MYQQIVDEITTHNDVVEITTHSDVVQMTVDSAVIRCMCVWPPKEREVEGPGLSVPVMTRFDQVVLSESVRVPLDLPLYRTTQADSAVVSLPTGATGSD